MPRIVKWSEKQRCIKPKYMDLWTEDYKYKYVRPVAEKAVAAYKAGNKITVFQLIEEIIDSTLPGLTDEWFNKFVEVKKLDDYISF